MNDFDFDKLRHDLTDYYGTAAFAGFPVAFMDVARMESASREELLREATKNGFNLDKYSNNNNNGWW